MEYEDELERMRDRRRRERARRQQDTGNTSHTGRRSGPVRDGYGDRRGREQNSAGWRRPTGDYDSRYYDDSYEHGRQRRDKHRSGAYDSDYEEYEDYDRYDEYDSGYDEYAEIDDGSDGYGGYDEYEDGYSRGGLSRSNGRITRGERGGTRPAPKTRVRQPKTAGEPERNSQKPRRKKHRFLFLKLFALFFILAGAYFVFQFKQTGTGYWTVAVFGVDSRDGKLEKGALSDVEMICVIDRGTGDIKLVSVFRDTYLEIHADGTYHKINEAYFKGGHEQAIEALERNLDLSVDDYATFNWKAVVDAINILGGIDLEISDSEFKYINSFITETVESTGIGSYHLEHAGMNHLDGVQAVAYARLRLMDTDYNRTARQRLVIQLAMNKAKEADLKTLTGLVKVILPQISTSIGVDDLLPLARNIRKFNISETGGFPFSRGETHIGKKDCVIPLTLESNVIQLHQFLYGTENFQPSQTVKQISAKIAADSGMGEVAENAPEAKVLGQKALEGSGSGTSGGNSGGETKGEGSKDPGNVGSPNPGTEAPTNPAPTDWPPASESEPSTETVSGSGSEILQDESQEAEESSEASTEEESSSESDQTGQEPGSGQAPAPSESGPQNPGETQQEVGPGMTSAAAEEPSVQAPGEKPVEETVEVGPGV